MTVAVEYKPPENLSNYDSKYTSKDIKAQAERVFQKQKLCQENSITFIEWHPVDKSRFVDDLKRDLKVTIDAVANDKSLILIEKL
jgi:hypothetical protein